MKKLSKYALFLLLTLIAAVSFAACGKVDFKVNFVVDGEIWHTINTNGSEIIIMPDNPTKEGYEFDGWFWDKDTWERDFTANSLLNEPLSGDMSVYVKWKPVNVAADNGHEPLRIVAEYEHNRHDGRKDTILIYNDNTYEWAVSINGIVSKTYFFTAEELFEFATKYKSNWNHNNWVKVDRE